jgi:hypothetical protein
MRLINSATLELKEFAENDIPKYAILSHTWGSEEVSLQDVQRNDTAGKVGYSKIKSCGAQAAIDGFDYFWVDTCCIDKSSSAELSEAINSMYRWYKNAEICYAYLADVLPDVEPRRKDSPFRNSRWFTRGWTLQELIAPLSVTFYASDWREIGTRSDLEETISEITGIDIRIFRGEHPRTVSIAQRMCWASKRETTRTEDIAYCLLGIFE